MVSDGQFISIMMFANCFIWFVYFAYLSLGQSYGKNGPAGDTREMTEEQKLAREEAISLLTFEFLNEKANIVREQVWPIIRKLKKYFCSSFSLPHPIHSTHDLIISHYMLYTLEHNFVIDWNVWCIQVATTVNRGLPSWKCYAPLKRALVLPALHLFLPAGSPYYITNQFLVKFYPIFM